MTLDDISRWVNRLLTEKQLGWSDNPKLLAHLMGLREVFMLRSRTDGRKRMTRTEQMKASAMLERIIRGEIQCEQRFLFGKWVGMAVEVANPRPLEGSVEGCRFTLKTGKKGLKLQVLPKKLLEKRRPLVKVGDVWLS